MEKRESVQTKFEQEKIELLSLIKQEHTYFFNLKHLEALRLLTILQEILQRASLNFNEETRNFLLEKSDEANDLVLLLENKESKLASEKKLVDLAKKVLYFVGKIFNN